MLYFAATTAPRVSARPRARRQLARLRLLMTGLALAGCQQLLGLDDLQPGASGPTADAAIADTGPRADAVPYPSDLPAPLLFGGATIAGDTDSANAETWRWSGETDSWQRAETAAAPPPRLGHAMAYDAHRDAVVLFGGLGERYLGDTWLWRAGEWREAATAGPAPPARGDHALAYDPARGELVLFGGHTGSAALGDTWLWNGTSWRAAKTAALAPTPRRLHAMSYDPVSGGVVLFGGLGPASAGRLGDTWLWDGTTWRELNPELSPRARTGHALTVDPATGGVLLFGGLTAADSEPTAPVADTWSWDGSAWRAASSPLAPPARHLHLLAHDAASSGLLLVGGLDSEGHLLADMWRWAEGGWSRLSSDPGALAPRWGSAVAP